LREEVRSSKPAESADSKVDFDLKQTDVLIIEDEELMAALVQRYIQDFSQNLPISLRNHKLESGWKLLNADLSHIKIAVVDILLPQVTGADLIRHFRSQYPKIGIVPITGMASGPMRRQIQEALPPGFSILDKPLRKNEFLEAFSKAYEYSNKAPGPVVKVAPETGTGEDIWTSALPSKVPTPQFKKKVPKPKAS
jgi:DNA-binding NarL/FixJ family response regulator